MLFCSLTKGKKIFPNILRGDLVADFARETNSAQSKDAGLFLLALMLFSISDKRATMNILWEELTAGVGASNWEIAARDSLQADLPMSASSPRPLACSPA